MKFWDKAFVFSGLYNHFFRYPTPININYFWNLGFISFSFLVIQILSGFFLSLHYSSDVFLAFASIEHIMRDVNYGWLIRFCHSNGASFFFLAVYIHISKNIYYRLYGYDNLKIWVSGLIIFLFMMATAFVGYVLPWGQMSFWGATVITNLFSAVPMVGDSLVYWIWGGFSVDNPTLTRFYSFHYILPFLLLSFVFLHFLFLHEKGSSNPSFISEKLNRFNLTLYPYFIIKDLFGFLFYLLFYFFFVFYYPDFLGHSDNYIQANPMQTPEHIVPEWYFLPFYAILRSIDDKLLGVIFMFLSILIFFLFPFTNLFIDRLFLNYSHVNASFLYNKYLHPFFSWCFFVVFILLGWVGSNPVEYPFVILGNTLIFFYFALILFLIFFIPIFILLFYSFFFRKYLIFSSDI